MPASTRPEDQVDLRTDVRLSAPEGWRDRGVCDPLYRMATTTMVHVRLDEKIKARAEKALAAMGLSVSDAVRVLLTRVAAEKALPFQVKVPNARTRAAMKELEGGKLRRFAGVDDLMADLRDDAGD